MPQPAPMEGVERSALQHGLLHDLKTKTTLELMSPSSDMAEQQRSGQPSDSRQSNAQHGHQAKQQKQDKQQQKQQRQQQPKPQAASSQPTKASPAAPLAEKKAQQSAKPSQSSNAKPLLRLDARVAAPAAGILAMLALVPLIRKLLPKRSKPDHDAAPAHEAPKDAPKAEAARGLEKQVSADSTRSKADSTRRTSDSAAASGATDAGSKSFNTRTHIQEVVLRSFGSGALPDLPETSPKGDNLPERVFACTSSAEWEAETSELAQHAAAAKAEWTEVLRTASARDADKVTSARRKAVDAAVLAEQAKVAAAKWAEAQAKEAEARSGKAPSDQATQPEARTAQGSLSRAGSISAAASPVAQRTPSSAARDAGAATAAGSRRSTADEANELAAHAKAAAAEWAKSIAASDKQAPIVGLVPMAQLAEGKAA